MAKIAVNLNKPNHIDAPIWALFCAVVKRDVDDISHCQSTYGRQIHHLRKSLEFFKNGGGLHQWLAVLKIRGDDPVWERIRQKGYSMAVDKEAELLAQGK